MRLIVAQESDSERLKKFFSEQQVPGVVTYQVERHGSFFDKYRMQSDDFVTFMLIDRQDQIQGTATSVFRKGVLNGVEQNIAYAMDLRISKSRKAVMQWANLFLDNFDIELKNRNCLYTFSAIERTESQAYNALIRPRHSRRKLPRYYLYRQLYAVSIHGSWPLAPDPLVSLKIENGSKASSQEIYDYIENKKKDKSIFFPLTYDQFDARLKKWRGLDWTDFIIARDSKNNICGCLAPWDSSHIQSLKVLEYSGRSHLLYQGLEFARVFRLGNRLPHLGDNLPAVYLTHLEVDNPDIFYTLLCEAQDRLEDNQFLLYGAFKGDYTLRPPRSQIFAQIPYGLYSVLRPQQKFPDFLRPNPWIPPPNLDLAEL